MEGGCEHKRWEELGEAYRFVLHIVDILVVLMRLVLVELCGQCWLHKCFALCH